MVLNPSIFGAVGLSAIRRCTVRPDGPSTAVSGSGPAVSGPRGVGHWTTLATVRVPSQRIGVPAELYHSVSSTRSDTVDLLVQLIEGVVLPKAASLAMSALANKDVYPELTTAHVDETGYDWDDGIFLAEWTVPSLIENVPALEIIFAEQAPEGVRQLIESLVAGFVVPAVAEELGLPSE